jgi:hypothetical protein
MNNPSLLIAIGVVALYTILGPVVLLAIYTLFDSISQRKHSSGKQNTEQAPEKKDPLTWTRRDVQQFVKRNSWF